MSELASRISTRKTACRYPCNAVLPRKKISTMSNEEGRVSNEEGRVSNEVGRVSRRVARAVTW